MKNNLGVRISRHIYARLLNLYPKAHRNEYGPDMLQVFTDECKACFEDGKGIKLLPLWLRTLGDLIVNVVKEHISDPQSTVGLMEAVPNSPLPWKGVLLVLIPGLIFFVSQVALLMNGKDWLAWMSRRAAYVLILPVLVLWIWKRKFPVWGLVPLGLLFSTFLASFWYHFEVLGVFFNTGHIIVWLNEQTRGLFPSLMNKTLAITFLLCTIALLWLLGKRARISKSAWVWLGVYGLLIILNFWQSALQMLQNMSGNFLHMILVIAYFGFYSYGGYLVLILLGTFLAKRHGRLTILLLVGFLLPALIGGKGNWPSLVYRFLVALAAPIWIVRSTTGKMQRRAGVISIAALLVIQLVVTRVFTAPVIIDQLILAAGLALAFALYGKAPDTRNTQPEMDMILEGSSIHNG